MSTEPRSWGARPGASPAVSVRDVASSEALFGGTRDEEIRGAQRAALLSDLGPELCAALEDADVTDIHVRSGGVLWLTTYSRGRVQTGVVFEPGRVAALIEYIAGLLSEQPGHVGEPRIVNHRHPVLDCDLPFFGHRIHAAVPPYSRTPELSIRKHAAKAFPFSDYTRTPKDEEVIREALRERRNILLAGGTGAGKTACLRSILTLLLEEVGPNEALFVVEDTRELNIPMPGYNQRQATPERGLLAALKDAMRVEPDRIMVGEVRGAEAHELLKYWNSGHPGGLCTIHANSAEDAMHRLEDCVEEAGFGVKPRRIARTLDYVLHLVRDPQERRRRISGLLRVEGFDGESYVLREVAEPTRQGRTDR